ncbi:DUF4911 domain-containing protein [Geobacter pelophilus]|uniref:DUF4911 domain-containing protein n=1 Tax=Geoanaerobacter pelophilus TaxID=60036 RepID=A0AAW4L8T9_9BACT|nr:DUF4911 domain-containing protein [Geoanaerobacter pelophilus]MBT0666270.1 DUF4911 domain-containing protein [Geoanaerobacter pelophilus]
MPDSVASGQRFPETVKARYFRVDRRDIVYLKFILEAYEGLSTMSTADRKEGIVRISFSTWAEQDIGDLLAALAADIELVEVSDPMEAINA